jgi:hypothetical protein
VLDMAQLENRKKFREEKPVNLKQPSAEKVTT